MLMRTDPFRDLDRLAQQVLGTPARPAAMPIDAYRRGDEFVVEFDLPGVDADSIELTVEKNVLTVHAERRRVGRRGVELLVGERPHGTFSRQLFLGDTLDTERIEADYVDGVLTLRLPVAEKAKPRRVEINDRRARAEGHRRRLRGAASTPPPDPSPALRLPIDDEHAPIYTVGQVAGMLGVQPAFVRRLDTEAVVQPARSDGGQRRYSRAEISAVQQVAAMADEGMSLPGIRRILVLEAEVTRLRSQIARLEAHSSAPHQSPFSERNPNGPCRRATEVPCHSGGVRRSHRGARPG